MQDGTGKLDALNTTLGGVENKLLHRALDRSRGEVEHAYDFINKAAEDGAIEIECPGCGDESAEVSGDGSGETLPEIPVADQE